MKKGFWGEEVLEVCRECVGSERECEEIEVDGVVKYGKRRKMVDRVIGERRKDMEGMGECGEKNDDEGVKEWIDDVRG